MELLNMQALTDGIFHGLILGLTAGAMPYGIKLGVKIWNSFTGG